MGGAPSKSATNRSERVRFSARPPMPPCLKHIGTLFWFGRSSTNCKHKFLQIAHTHLPRIREENIAQGPWLNCDVPQSVSFPSARGGTLTNPKPPQSRRIQPSHKLLWLDTKAFCINVLTVTVRRSAFTLTPSWCQRQFRTARWNEDLEPDG